MAMQDKEFDKIFNEKFEDFEVEPSAMVWDNITGELGSKKTKAAMMPWLSIAATVLVVLGAGIFFLQKDNSSNDQPKQNKPIANNVEAPVIVAPKQVQPMEDIVTKQTDNSVTSVVKHQPNSVIPANNSAVVADNAPIVATKQTEPVKTDNTPLISAVPDPASAHVSAATTASVPDVQLAPKVDETPQVLAARPVMASQTATSVKKRGIHSFGGLINALVAKVDKREDKLIEFSDGDEDDENATKLTGVNLGLIKIKQQ